MTVPLPPADPARDLISTELVAAPVAPELPSVREPLEPWLGLVRSGELAPSAPLDPDKLADLTTRLEEIPAALRAPLVPALTVVLSQLHPGDRLTLLNRLQRVWPRSRSFPLEYLEAFERAAAGALSPDTLERPAKPDSAAPDSAAAPSPVDPPSRP